MAATPDDTGMFAAAMAALKAGWPHVASFIGAVLSLSFVERLTPRGKLVAVAIGFFTALCVGPITYVTVHHFAPFLPVEIVAPGFNFLIALSAMTILPPALRAIATKAGDPEWVSVLLKRVSP